MNDIFREELRTPAQHLLSGYETGSAMFYTSAGQTMLARGLFTTVPVADRFAALHQRVGDALSQALQNGHPDPVVVGAIPFDVQQPACLTILRNVLRAAALHPTPAVCGFPGQRAKDLIRQTEPFERGFYTGMVGAAGRGGS